MFRGDSGFSRFMNLLGDILYIGILWILCSIPIVTAGASATAAYYAMVKSVRHRTGYISKEFFHSFKTNFKQQLPMTILFWMVTAVLVLDIGFLWSNESKTNNALLFILILVMFLVLGLAVYVCPLLSRFENKTLELLKQAGVLVFKYLPLTLGMLVLFAAACVGIYLMPWAILVIPGVYLYLLTFPMEKILKKLMPPAPCDSEEAEKWYYQ